MATAIYILDDSYDSIISRLYKYELDSYHILNNFKAHIGPSISSSVPIVEFDGVNYIYVMHHNLVFLAVSIENIDAMLLFQFLYRLINLLQCYLEVEILDKEMIQSNYILVYQLLDEVLDYGIPQSTDFSILREYLKADDDTKQLTKENSFESDINYSISRTSTTKISWRPKGIFYKKNEIFIDLIESVSLHYNLQNNEIKKNHISGELNSKCYLSGMPTCKIGLNELLVPEFETESVVPKKRMIFDNINFHQCVELSNLNKNALQFLPPDGSAKLINYSIVSISTANLKPIVLVEPVYRIFNRKNDIKLRLSIDLKTFFKKKYLIKNLEILIPIRFKQQKDAPQKFCINFNKPPRFKSKIGNVILNLDKNLIVWKIPSINGNSSSSIFTNSSANVDDRYQMISEFELITETQLSEILDRNEYYDKVDSNSLYYSKLIEESLLIKSKKPITDLVYLNFEIPYLSYSGLKVEYLKIIEDQYHFQSFPWVRYLIKNDDYCFKLGERNFVDQIKYGDLKRFAEQEDHTVQADEIANSPNVRLQNGDSFETQSVTESALDEPKI